MNCPSGKILNHKTGRCVNKDGKLGRELRSRSCDSKKILNPKTGRCVNKDGKIGREILGKEHISSFNGKIRTQETCKNEWQKKSKIGQGGVGSVYSVCRDTCNYVMKIQKNDKPFRKEVKFFTMLNDSGITPILYDAWVCKEKGFMIIEKLNNTTTLTMPEIRKKLQSTINKLHKMNIVFFDIHKDNVIYKYDKVFLIDFGHAKHYRNKSEKNNSLPWDVIPMNFEQGVEHDKLLIDFYWGDKSQKEKASKKLKDFGEYYNEPYFF